MIDVGACSTRPGAQLVNEELELKRLSRALNAIRKKYPDATVSIDTFRARLEKAEMKFRASMGSRSESNGTVAPDDL